MEHVLEGNDGHTSSPGMVVLTERELHDLRVAVHLPGPSLSDRLWAVDIYFHAINQIMIIYCIKHTQAIQKKVKKTKKKYEA